MIPGGRRSGGHFYGEVSHRDEAQRSWLGFATQQRTQRVAARDNTNAFLRGYRNNRNTIIHTTRAVYACCTLHIVSDLGVLNFLRATYCCIIFGTGTLF